LVTKIQPGMLYNKTAMEQLLLAGDYIRRLYG
jgi:hypothetical protein